MIDGHGLDVKIEDAKSSATPELKDMTRHELFAEAKKRRLKAHTTMIRDALFMLISDHDRKVGVDLTKDGFLPIQIESCNGLPLARRREDLASGKEFPYCEQCQDFMQTTNPDLKNVRLFCCQCGSKMSKRVYK